MNHVGKGLVIAGAAAALILSGSAVARAASHGGDGSVKCVGGNACSGKTECGTAKHDCAGKNECKGKGWVMADSAEACEKLGGKVEEKKKDH